MLLFSVLDYWAKLQHRFPNLHSLARKVLAIPASNTEVERLFSCSKLTVTDYRTRLGAEKVNKLTFLRKNLHSLKQLDEKIKVAENGRKRKSIDEHECESEDDEQQTPSSILKKYRIENENVISSEDELED